MLEVEGQEGVSLAQVAAIRASEERNTDGNSQFGLELDPMETESVQEGGKALHQHENREREHAEREEDGERGDDAHNSGLLQSIPQDHVPQHFAQL